MLIFCIFENENKKRQRKSLYSDKADRDAATPKMRWLTGKCAGLRIERFEYEPLGGALHCVLGQNTLLS